MYVSSGQSILSCLCFLFCLSVLFFVFCFFVFCCCFFFLWLCLFFFVFMFSLFVFVFSFICYLYVGPLFSPSREQNRNLQLECYLNQSSKVESGRNEALSLISRTLNRSQKLLWPNSGLYRSLVCVYVLERVWFYAKTVSGPPNAVSGP